MAVARPIVINGLPGNQSGRLTQKKKDGGYCLLPSCCPDMGGDLGRIIDKLGAYEDLGFSANALKKLISMSSANDIRKSVLGDSRKPGIDGTELLHYLIKRRDAAVQTRDDCNYVINNVYSSADVPDDMDSIRDMNPNDIEAIRDAAYQKRNDMDAILREYDQLITDVSVMCL